MQFDLDNLNAGEWFDFFTSEIKEDGKIEYHDPIPSAGRFHIRNHSVDSLAIISKATRGKKVNVPVMHPLTKVMGIVIQYDQTPEQEQKEREMLWDHVIVDWEGLKDKNDNEIPVTLENKMRLLEIPRIMRFVSRCLELIDKQKENAEKN